ncbi:Succinyl-diaminopimelate desuccinylase [Rubripirellula amarantea]|uniref:Succinyl-diaminopimelate desuccinylase n=1 Tax=Rubripirellula amarantea TaxID=2527999 RepID=A0A5C5WU10_9BACT|nr:M20/M25/M40 family metallo-hydrolase [Rubripirellula amarantea]TWT53342.1 Succinyl-diaminopimelate desuccinylase [Rubripirellula amarantea]
MISLETAGQVTQQRLAALTHFTQRIVQTPSLSGHEGDAAALIVREMESLRYDDVWVDEVGNIIGRIKGGNGPTIMLNGHMDVVDPGPDEGWPHAAYSGEIVDGHLWGRGSVDMKGPVAAMIYGASLFKHLDIQPTGDVLMTVAVMEEIGGLGSQFLVEHTQADGAIVGEPSENELRLGHRGRIEVQVKFHGRSAHASVPHLGINPHFAAAEFLNRLDEVSLGCDPVLGQSTIAPTLYQTDQVSPNVIPSEVTLFLDWRNVPSETPEHARSVLQKLAEACAADGSDPPEVTVTHRVFDTYTGAKRNFAAVFPPFATSPTDALALAAAKVISNATGQTRAGVWQFATDGGHLMSAGIPVVGFGPGDDRLAHTNQERINIAELQLAAATYTPLCIALASAIEKGTL